MPQKRDGPAQRIVLHLRKLTMYNLLFVAAVASATYLLALAFHRLYLHPLAKFPGPKLAALSRWYEFYYDVALRGQFTFHVQELHRRYGPIVRITPDELHILDSAFWDTLYGPGRVGRYEYYYNRQNIPNSLFAASDHNLHKLRKSPLLPLFSKKRISDLQPVVREKLDLFCSKIDEYATSGGHFAINRAFTAFSGDVITTYVFGDSYHHLESRDFKESFLEPFMAASESGHIALQFKWIYPVLKMLPDWLVLKLQPQMYLILQLAKVGFFPPVPISPNDWQDFDVRLKAILSGTAKENPEHPTILFEMLRSDLPPEEKKIDRLNEEAQLLVAAGLVTTAWALSVTAFHVINSPQIYSQLRTELVRAIPNKSTQFFWSDVENLPYLNGCIREGLRLAYGVSSRSPRVWDKPLEYAGWKIPARTPVGLTLLHHNHNEDLFTDSHSFRPDRWLTQDSEDSWVMNREMDKIFFSFGKGSRSCLGVNLATAELHMGIATLFRRYDFKLFETNESDVVVKHDFFLPSPRLDSKGIRVTVKKAER